MNTSQSVQKEEIRKEYEALRGEIKLTSVEKWLDSIVDRISASVREDEKQRILACGNAHEAINGFQPYGYIKNVEMERHIYMDGFADGRAMLMIDVMGKRDPRLENSALQKLSD